VGGDWRAHDGIADAPRDGQRPFDAGRFEEQHGRQPAIAIEAMGAARHPHSFLGIDQDGATSIVRTTGNFSTHIVLRGGRTQTNYDTESIRAAEAKLKSEKLPPVLMVDCSHANSGKQPAGRRTCGAA